MNRMSWHACLRYIGICSSRMVSLQSTLNSGSVHLLIFAFPGSGILVHSAAAAAWASSTATAVLTRSFENGCLVELLLLAQSTRLLAAMP